MAPGARKKTPETGVAASVTLEQSSDSVPSSAPAVSDEDLLSRVDMRKPIIPQVYHLLHVPVSRGGLSKALYLRWVHTPHYFKEEPKYMRFFESEWREALSKVVWWVVPLWWLPLIFSSLYYFSTGLTPLHFALLVGGGITYWSLVEYCLHRFVFHMDQYTPDSPKALALHFCLHGVHHKVPNDRYRLVFPPLPAMILCLLVGLLSRVLWLPIIASASHFMIFYSSMVFGYVMYDMAHYAFHHGTYSPRSLMGRLRKYHLRHHYNDQYNLGFGITSPVWDYVFATPLPVD